MTLKWLLVFLSGLLLFAVEPLIGKMILPSTGGGAHVWSTTLMFFQGGLVLGYLYSHSLGPKLGRWHFLVACTPLAFLPVAASIDFDPAAPALSILTGLIAGVGLPFVVLSTTTVLVQSWAALESSSNGRNPYTLYAASNAGSLIGLLAYPLLIAPLLTLRAQSWLWSACYLVFLGLLWKCMPAKQTGEDRAPDSDRRETDGEAMGGWNRILAWFLLSAAPSVMLLAITAFVAQHLGSGPLVWVVPLALYLTSFIVVFREQPWVPWLLRRFWFEIATVGVFLFFIEPNPAISIVLVHLVVLFAVSLVAHSALYESRPPPSRLSGFYLVVALGGWAGGAFVAFAAPRLFDRMLEYPIAVAVVAATLLVSRWRPFLGFLQRESRLLLAGSMAFLVLVGFRAFPIEEEGGATEASYGSLHRERNAHGVYQVRWFNSHEKRRLTHNSVEHGMQILTDQLRRRPLGYHSLESPLADILLAMPKPLNAAVVGLGAGATAAYFGEGDEVTFFELDPYVVELAQSYFTYLEDCEATVQIKLGDARVQLARSTDDDGRYDVMFLDAFSGRSVPTHLLTREAIELYFRKLKPRGLLIFQATNGRLELRPVLRAAGDAVHAHGAYKIHESFLYPWETPSRYYALTREPEVHEWLLLTGWAPGDDAGGLPRWAPWTDDYANILKPLLAKSSFWGK